MMRKIQVMFDDLRWSNKTFGFMMTLFKMKFVFEKRVHSPEPALFK